MDKNWKSILDMNEPLIGKLFRRGGKLYIFVGILHSNDDYYFVMKKYGTKKCLFLSCVGSIGGHGFEAM